MGESQAQPKLQQLVATVRKRQQEEVEARVRAEGAVWQEEVAQAKKREQAARRAVKDEHEGIYQKVVAEHERYIERAVPYKSLRYNRESAEAGRPQEIRAVRLQDGEVTGNKREVLEEVVQSFWKQHNQGQQGLSETTPRMVQVLARVFGADQSEAIQRSRVKLGEIKEAVLGSGPTWGGGILQPRGARTGWAGGQGDGCVVHRQAPSGVGGQGAAPL